MMRRKVLITILCLCLVVPPNGWSFFGLDTAPLIAILSQQLTTMQQTLSSAEDTLSRVEDLQRGINSTRTYSLKHPYMALVRESAGVTFSQSNFDGMLRALEAIYPVIQAESMGEIPEITSSLLHRNISSRSFYLAEQTKSQTVPNDLDQGVNIVRAGQAAQSGAEASKVTAEAAGMLVYQNSELLALQAQQLEVSAANLEIHSASQRDSAVANQTEMQRIARDFEKIPPIR